MKQFFRRLNYLVHRGRFDRELAADLEFHRRMSSEGLPLGSELQLREQARDAWGWTWIDRLGQDLRYAGRTLRRSPGFTLAAVVMLAIGIGVNVAVFGFFDLMVLRPLNIRQPETLFRFHRRSPEAYAFALPYPEMAFFRDHARTLSAVLALNTTRVAIEGEDQQINADFVSGNFFSDLGSAPLLGRLFDPGRDDAPGADPVVVLEEGFWERHFGADRQVVGRTIRINGKAATVIGVARRDFSGLNLGERALWAPLSQQPYFASGSHLLTAFTDTSGVRMFGRLAPGVGPRAAEEELKSLAAELHREHPAEIWANETLPSDPGGYAKSMLIGNRSGTGSEQQSELYPVMALISLLGLLILAVACGNLGSLLLARGVARDREISIRVAVGAGKGRLVRQLFTESLVLACLGATAGLATGWAVLQGLLAATHAPGWLDPSPDWRLALFALAAGFAAAILFGLTPAFATARQRHRATLARQILVGAQVAASCVLLIVAGLLSRALQHALSSSPGYEYQQVVSVDPALASHGYTSATAKAYFDALASRLRAMPGVDKVSLAMSPPLGRRSESAGIDLDGRRLSIQINRVDPQFFATMAIPLLRGRNFAPGETHAVIVGESLAASAWPGRDPLGKKFFMDGDSTVIGIVRSARLVKLEDSNSSEVYFPLRPEDLPGASLLVKANGAPESIARAAMAAARSIDRGAFPEVLLLKTGYREKLRSAEASALTVTVLSMVADLLACLGIIGVVAYAVSQRTREIGVRMALGAKPMDILRVVLRQFSRPVLAGLALGVAGAAILSGLLRGQLYGISNFDPGAYLAAIALFVLTVLLAAIWPARRALTIDPLQALRHE